MGIRRALSFTAIGVLLGAALGLVIWGGRPEAAQVPTPAGAGSSLTPVVAPLVGGRAPDFAATSVDGVAFRLSEQRGHPLLVTFWATWCEPCRAEMPLFDERAQAFAERGLIVVGVNFDESAPVVREYRDGLGIDFPLLLDPGGGVQSLYRIVGYPTTYFIDDGGVIRALHLGVMDEAQLDAYLLDLGLG